LIHRKYAILPDINIREFETMATKAKPSSKARSAKTTRPASGAAARTTKKPTTAVKAKAAVAQSAASKKTYRFTDDLSGTQVLGEMLGTFLLVSLVAATGGNAFLVGIGYIAIVLMFFKASGAQVNPAVTFGLWAMRKLSTAKMLFYWMAQFVGAIAAILVMNAFASSKFEVSLASFTQWDWAVVSAEVFGAAIFMFAVAAVLHRSNSDTERGVGLGIGLFVALLVSSAMLQQAITSASSNATEASEAPRITRLTGTTVNPAVALSLKETDSSNVNPLTGEQEGEAKNTASRLTIETIVGTLVGAALGGRLFVIFGRASRD
jgi:aquaporin Z